MPQSSISPSVSLSVTDSRERILAAAERLYAEKGVETTSTREITAAAGVNVASVNYYFRSKGALNEEIFMRLAERVTMQRLADLAVLTRSAKQTDETMHVADLIDCFLRPYFEPELSGALLARFILLHRAQPSEMSRRVFEHHLDPFAAKFIDALCLTDKRVPRVEWLWRYNLMTGAVVVALSDTGPENRMVTLSGGKADATLGDDLQRHLAEFLARALTGTASPL